MSEQRLLFPTSADAGPAYGGGPLTHRDDPETSREAAEHLKQSGRLGAQQEAVLATLRECDGSTHAELGRVMGCDWLVAARRLPELERAGLVRKGKARICRVKGSRCTTWWTVAASACPENAVAGLSKGRQATNGAEGESKATG